MAIKPISLDRMFEGPTFYHGSKGGIKGEVRPSSRRTCDFGAGFYLGNSRDQAFSICLNKGAEPHFYEAHLDMYGLHTEILSGLQWVMFVGYNRGAFVGAEETVLCQSMNEFRNNVDIIIGDIADDSIYPAFDDFESGILTSVGLQHALLYMKLGQQFVCVSQRACNTVDIHEVSLTSSELKHLQEYDMDRQQWASTALTAIRNLQIRKGKTFRDYYREGLFNKRFETLSSAFE